MEILTAETRSLDKHIREVNRVSKSLGLSEVEFNIKDVIKEKGREKDRIDKALAAVRREVDTTLNARATDPLQGFGEIATTVGRFMSGAGSGISNFSNVFLGKFKAIAKGTGVATQYSGKGIAAMGGFTAAIAPLIMAQEKNIRAMLDYGMLFDNLDEATKMRTEAANLGMSISEMLKSNEAMRVAFVNSEDSIADSAMAYNRFFAVLASNSRNDQGFNQFGLTATQFQKSMSDVTSMLYNLGEIQNLNVPVRKQIRDTFSTTQQITLAVANLTGINREQLINAGLEAKSREDITMNLLRNKLQLEEKYGEGATVQIQLNYDYLSGLIGTMMPSIAGEADTTMKTFVARSTVTDNVNQSLTQQLQDILALGGSELTSEFTTLIEDSLTGRIDREEITRRFRDMVNTAKDLPTVPAVGDQSLDAFNNLVNTATTIPETFTEVSDEVLASQIDGADAKVDDADDAIEAVESAKVALRKVQDFVVPGYGSLAEIFATSTEQIERFRDALVDVGFIDPANVTSVTDKIDEENRAGPAPGSSEALALAGQEGGYGGTYDPNTGSIIRDDEDIPFHTTPSSPATGYVPSRDGDMTAADDERIPVPENDRVQYDMGNKIRNRPLDEALMTVLRNAAIVTDPNLTVTVTSGGQMSMEDYVAAAGRKTNSGGGSPTYYLDGEAVRKGSRRHDDGLAADVKVKLNGEFIKTTHPKFLMFVEAAHALGIRAGSAAHGYMGDYTAHLDVVGTDKGGGVNWSNAHGDFVQAQSAGLGFYARPEINPYLQRLEEIKAAETAKLEQETVTTTNVTDPTSNVNTTSNSSVPDDGTNDRIANIERLIREEQARITRSIQGENEYWGSEKGGRRNSELIIRALREELEKMVTITQQYRTDAIIGAQ